jgi:organic hydroperoxide reductase OsmC/OhrA
VSHHVATVVWKRAQDEDFTAQRYSRGHHWEFDGGVDVPASASPQVVPAPWSVAAAVDPEEAFVAALASCHMLWFLSLAAKAGHVVEGYRDAATGRMGRNAAGKVAMLEVTLRPDVTFGGAPPDAAALDALHHAAHEACYLASSVTTDVRCEPVEPR